MELQCILTYVYVSVNRPTSQCHLDGTKFYIKKLIVILAMRLFWNAYMDIIMNKVTNMKYIYTVIYSDPTSTLP